MTRNLASVTGTVPGVGVASPAQRDSKLAQSPTEVNAFWHLYSLPIMLPELRRASLHEKGFTGTKDSSGKQGSKHKKHLIDQVGIQERISV